VAAPPAAPERTSFRSATPVAAPQDAANKAAALQRFTFYASFIPGLQEVIAETLKERLPDIVIRKLLDGAVLFETSCSYDKLNFFCFNNIFALLSLMEHTSPFQALEKHIKTVVDGNAIPQSATEIIAHNSSKFKTFRIVVSRENKPAAIDEKLRSLAEKYISRISGLAVNRSRPDAEFWFLYRRESGFSETGFSCFMKRLTLRPSWEKSLHPGELPPPLAWILCRLAKLVHTGTALDPFCGYGAIPFAALKFFHLKKFIACDSDPKAAAYTKARFKNRGADAFELYQADFRSLVSVIPPHSIDAIITDPPWGFWKGGSHESESPHEQIAHLYDDMFNVFKTLLKADGRIVLLCARNESLPAAAAKHGFQIQKEIPILLSGKKAGIFQLSV
jgi:tRNA G10  N-methylase Trm11